jgi:hypothetical protein
MAVCRVEARTLAILCLLLASSAPAGDDDLLKDVAEPLRSSILSKLDKRGECEIRVLENEFGVKFAKGSPASEPGDVGLGRCTDGSEASTADIASAASLTDPDRRFDWFSSPAAYCAYKRKLAVGLKRAAKGINRNTDFEFTDSDIGCNLSGLPEWKKIKGSFCYMATQNASSALESFYTGKCELDCGSGVVALEQLGALELFKGENGEFDGNEEAWFNHYYPTVCVGPFQGEGSKEGIEGTKSPYWGASVKKKLLPASSYAQYGKYGLTGIYCAIGTKDHYVTAVQKKTTGDFQRFANFKQNFVILETSEEAAKRFTDVKIDGEGSVRKLVGKFEQDFKTLGEELLKLSFNRDSEVTRDTIEEHPEIWKAWQQVTHGANYRSIVDGTYVFRNLTAKDCPGLADELRANPGLKLKNPSEKQCPALYRIRQILADPVYRDTQVQLHPTGIISLGEVGLHVLSEHPIDETETDPAKKGKTPAPMAFDVFQTSESAQFDKYVAFRINSCMGKAPAN